MRKRSTRPFLICVFIALMLRADAAAAEDSAVPVFTGPRILPGWPVIAGNGIFSSPALADIDGDGIDEIAVGTRDGRVFLLDGTGSFLAGWPKFATSPVLFSPLFIDIDSDGSYEIMAAGTDGNIFAWETDGRPVPGWPVDLGGRPVSAPLAVGNGMLATALMDGRVFILRPDGSAAEGWPRQSGRQVAWGRDNSVLAVSDIDSDGSVEIVYGSISDKSLDAWEISGEECEGFPAGLPAGAMGLDVDDSGREVLIAVTTMQSACLFDSKGKLLWKRDINTPGDRFWAPPSICRFDQHAEDAGQAGSDSIYVAAATEGGKVFLWDRQGEILPGWPLNLGGFIYGVERSKENFSASCAPLARDVNGDGEAELLVCSYDQHVYCLDRRGRAVPGWPVTLEDAIVANPAFGDIDGVPGSEMILGQIGESVFAFHIGSMDDGPPGARYSRRSAVLEQEGEWPPASTAAAAAIALLALLLAMRIRSSLASRSGGEPPNGIQRTLLVFFTVFLAAGLVFFVLQSAGYYSARKRLSVFGNEGSEILRSIETHRAEADRRTAAFAASLDSSGVDPAAEPMRLGYVMERLADRFRLDYDRDGVAFADGQGRIIQALGLARGLVNAVEVAEGAKATSGIAALGDIPVFVSSSAVGSRPRNGSPPGTLILFSGILPDLPQEAADIAGASASLVVGGKTVGWGGPDIAIDRFTPWMGIVKPWARVRITALPDGRDMSLLLAEIDPWDFLAAWIGLVIVLLVPFVFYFTSIWKGLRLEAGVTWWWFILYGAVYAAGWLVITKGGSIQRPVPIGAFYLEILLHFLGMAGLAVAYSAFVGPRVMRRLNAALAGSYLIVSVMPLAFVLAFGTMMLKEAQRRALASKFEAIERRADNTALSYAGKNRFKQRLSTEAKDIMQRPPEERWFDFVGDNQYFLTNDYPSAYLTLSVHSREDPSEWFTGYSWRAPRTGKFFSRMPAWIEGSEVKGVFIDKGSTIVRAMRSFNMGKWHSDLVCHIPVDRTVMKELEESLRILPFLPPVKLLPEWMDGSITNGLKGGIPLPYSTRLMLRARDWNTGEGRLIVYRAEAYLPPGRGKWPVLGAIALLILLPLALSWWGAFFTFRRTIRPMSRLLIGIRRVETGDLDYRLGSVGRSEIATSARAFDRMAGSLKDQVKVLADKKKVEEISELKSRFISMVSHDLKTPLAAITGAAHNMMAGVAGPLTEHQRTYLDMIQSSGANLQEMISNLLDLSQIESGRLVLSYETIDLAHEVEAVVRTVRALIEKKRLQVRVVSSREGENEIRADRTRLWQILNNLLSNAIRYSPKGGRIEIDVSPDAGRPGWRCLTISDQGPGVPPEERGRVFEPFYSRPAPADEARGKGLGLAITRQLVELHGGTISIGESQWGGARFTLTLPCPESDTKV